MRSREFEVVANRFDATQGRSAGHGRERHHQVGNEHAFAGTFGGYFRNDKFNAEDFISDRVLPYSNQQMSTTFGGPIVRDRIHFFGSYEFEREPKTFTYNSPYPASTWTSRFTTTTHKPLGRLDYQFTPQTRLSVRGSGYNTSFYEGGGAHQPIRRQLGARSGRIASSTPAP